MKNIPRILSKTFLLTTLFATGFIAANAQRGNNGAGRNNNINAAGRNTPAISRPQGLPSPSASFKNNRQPGINRSVQNGSGRQTPVTTRNFNNNLSPATTRNFSNEHNATVAATNRNNNTQRNNSSINNTNNANSRNTTARQVPQSSNNSTLNARNSRPLNTPVQQRNYNNNYRHTPLDVQRRNNNFYTYRPRNTVNVNINVGNRRRPGYGGFYYGGGYHYYPTYYRPYRRPVFGVHINLLPVNVVYYPFLFNSFNYYYNDGSYYRRVNNYYETVDAPLGAKVPQLPKGATGVVINGEKYFEHNGTYYKKELNERNETLFEVVGTDGVLDVDRPYQQQFQQLQKDNEEAWIETLPDGSNTLTLDGKTYFVTPNGEYYTQVYDSNNKTYYEKANTTPDN